MAVLVNFKICDNAAECGGIGVCPTKALSWDEKEETINIDNDKCISCGMCEKECPIGAIRVAKDDTEYEKIKKEIEKDPRTTKDLFVDRFGAVAISEFFKIELDDIVTKANNNCLTLIEVYNPDEAECLLKSIPIKELTKNLPSDTLFYKVESDKVLEDYKVEELPSLLVFKDGKLVGHIDGYYTVDNKDKVMSMLDNIVKDFI